MVRGDAADATWELECKAAENPDGGVEFTGPYIQGGPGRRFIYLSWGVVEEDGTFTMFRRAKLMLGDVPAEVARRAVDSGVLVGVLGLTDDRGNPLCAGCTTIGDQVGRRVLSTTVRRPATVVGLSALTMVALLASVAPVGAAASASAVRGARAVRLTSTTLPASFVAQEVVAAAGKIWVLGSTGRIPPPTAPWTRLRRRP